MSGQLKQVVAPTLLAAAAATIYTVPAGQAIGRWHVHVQNGDNVPRTFTLSLGADAAGTRLWDQVSIPANTDFDRVMQIPIEAAGFIQSFASAANKLVITIGAELRIV